MTFEREQLIRFSHCDPAGIVFFPQYFVLFNGHVEDWFDEGLGLGYAKVVIGQRIGLPTVALSCEFMKPSRMGERVQLGRMTASATNDFWPSRKSSVPC